MATSGEFPLRLGSINFDQPFEGPNGNNEGLGDVGSRMNMVVKEFPGGIMTAQLLGSVPKEIPLTGILFGEYARGRSFEFQRLCDKGELVTLSYAEYSFDGVVKDYQAKIKGPNEIHFTLLFLPLLNNSAGGSNGTTPATTDPMGDTVSRAVTAMNQQTAAPANGTQLPASVQQQSNALNATISQQLQQNGGNLTSLPVSSINTIRAGISNLLNLLSPLTNGSDPLIASAAADLSSTLFVLELAFNKGPAAAQPLNTFAIFNPDLYMLASYFYGNPARWSLIANATNAANLDQPLITDPNPIGGYTLVIPVDTTFELESSATVMSDGLKQAS